MASLGDSVNKYLKDMNRNRADIKAKGSYGEKAVLKVCEEFYQKCGGILIHSYGFNTNGDVLGNIKKEQGKFRAEDSTKFTEIDVLLVTKYKVFPIEVKSYHAKEIILTDAEIKCTYEKKNNSMNHDNKSPVHQNEMHGRYLYHNLFEAFTDGSPEFIIPIVVFVDECDLHDWRTDVQKEYIPACVLNDLRGILIERNKPCLGHQLNLQLIDSRLKESMVSNEKYLPVRY